MTVPTTTNKAIGTGNGVATVFPFTFGTLPTGDLVVSLFSVDGTEFPQVENTDYTVLGKGAEDGGSVVFAAPPPNLFKVLIQRILPTTQPDDLKNQGSYYPRTVERMFDRRAMVDQQLQETIARTLTLPPQVEGVSTELPAPEASNLIGWDATSLALRNFAPSEIGTTLAFSNFIADRYTATPGQMLFTLSADPGALANLDVSIDGVTQVPVTDYNYLGTALTFTNPMVGGETVLARYGTALPTGITSSAAVLFQQAGTGAVLRPSQDKMRETVSAEDFGAVADYNSVSDIGTDNTLAFSKAIDYLVSIGGGVLELGHGEYLGHIDIRHPLIRIEGKGSWATVLRNFGNSPVLSITNADRAVHDVDVSGMTIRNRNKAVYTSADGIAINGVNISTNCDFLTFRDIYIFQMRHGINLSGRSIWNLWEEVRVAESIVHGMNASGNDNLAQQSFMQCRFAVNGQHGIFLAHTFAAFPTVNWSFRSCTIERNNYNGVRLTGSAAGIQAWTFDNCYFEENTDGIPAGGGGGLVKAHFFCDVPNVFGLAFRECSMFGETGGDPAMDYHINVNTGGAGSHYGEVRNCRFGVATVDDIAWQKGLTLGKNQYTGGFDADPNQGSFIESDYTDAAASFTPAITFGGASVGVTYSSQIGRVVRHGNIVHFNIYVALTNKGASVGNMKVVGLPIAALNTTNVFQPVVISPDGFTGPLPPIVGYIRPGTTEIELYTFNGPQTALTNTQAGNFSSLMISATMLVR